MTTLVQARSAAASRTVPDPSTARRDVLLGLLFVVVLATAVVSLGVALLFPPAGENGWFTYAAVQPIRTFVWPFLTIAAANIVLAVVAGSVVAVLLTPGRGWRWAAAGSGLAILGGAFYAVGVGGWAMVYFFATDSGALDAVTATAFIDSINGDGVRVFAAAIGGALTIAVGSLLISVGLWRARTVPRWIPLLAIVGAVIAFFLPTDGPIGVLVEAPQAISTTAAAWFLWRRRADLAPEAGRLVGAHESAAAVARTAA